MDQFVVPQFIDVEDKIFGPITTRQFIMMVVGGLMIFLGVKILNVISLVIYVLFIIGVIALFGFYKVNGRAFHLFLLNIFQTLKEPTLRVWRKIDVTDVRIVYETRKAETQKVPVKLVSKSRISRMALVVDTGGAYKGEE